MTTQTATAEPRRYIAWLIIAWLWVGVPLTWGVVRTIVSSMPLFTTVQTTSAAK